MEPIQPRADLSRTGSRASRNIRWCIINTEKQLFQIVVYLIENVTRPDVIPVFTRNCYSSALHRLRFDSTNICTFIDFVTVQSFHWIRKNVNMYKIRDDTEYFQEFYFDKFCSSRLFQLSLILLPFNLICEILVKWSCLLEYT